MSLVAPVFHPFNSGNLGFIIYMAELRADEFGLNFLLLCSKHLMYEFCMQYILTFYAKLIWRNNIPGMAENISCFSALDNDRNFKQSSRSTT